MRALTIRQPWADAIAHGNKRVENRSWRAPAKYHGTRILIHAGATYDRMARFLIDRDHLAAWHDERKALIATATLTGCHRETGGCCAPWGEHDVWHWQLENVHPLPEPIPIKGALGLWTPTSPPATATPLTHD